MHRRTFLSLLAAAPGCKHSGSEPGAPSYPGCVLAPGPVVYDIWDTLYIGPAQDLNLITQGVNVWNWRGPAGKPMVVIDSCMNCNISLPLLVYGGTDKALIVRPQNPVPIDKYPVFIETQVECEGVINAHPFSPVEPNADGVWLDGGGCAILCSGFHFKSITNFKTNFKIMGQVRGNHIQIDHLHTNISGTCLLDISDPAVINNWINYVYGTDQAARDVSILDSFGKNYVLEVQRDPEET